ncbi:mitochondrial carrier domain-containing protein [Gorgonomyces haynaldii]|nr:mitochondrial carrier domain-containing protein [Gorgonomyces haynaldii]
MVSVNSPIIKAGTGSLSAVVASAIVYPLDVVTTRSQTPSQGKTAIYAGISMSLFQTFLSSFSYFYIYAFVQRIYKHTTTKPPSVWMELFLGAVAGALSRIATTPIGVLTTRKQTSNTTYLKALVHILKSKGVFGLWAGFSASLVLTVNPAITYGLFQKIKQPDMTPGQSFAAGAFTKSLATITTYPYILAKTRMQAGADTSISECLTKCYTTSGIPGLYQGLKWQLSKAVLQQGLLFMIQGELEKRIQELLESLLVAKTAHITK